MKKNKKLVSLLLVSSMLATMVGCGGNNKNEETSKTVEPTTEVTEEATQAPEPTTEEEQVERPAEKRIIKVGTWFDQYYTSDHTSIEDDPNLSDVDKAEMKLANIRAIEEKYNVEFRFDNLTWEGDIESINTSIAAGKPECDIYQVDLQFGVPAVLNGYAMAIEDFVPADDDVFKDQVVMKYLNLMDSEKNYLLQPQAPVLDGYILGYNKNMLEDAGLEDPQALYDRDEWTWDKFREYCLKLTTDTNGDGAVDVYGYGGPWTCCLSQLMMANGTGIAKSTTQGLDNPATIEALEFMYNLYNVDKSARPWNSDDWDDNVKAFGDGLCAFFVDAAWINQNFRPEDAEWDLGMVPWPIGPSGNKETNAQVTVAGNYFIIPTGVEDPEFVYKVLFDWCNWFNYDTDLRDDTEWYEDYCYTEENFAYLEEMGRHTQFDLWGNSGVSFDVVGMITGTKTASQVAEESKLLFQDYLDQYFK